MCGGRYHETKTNGTFDAVKRQHAAEIINHARRLAAQQAYELAIHDEAQPVLL